MKRIHYITCGLLLAAAACLAGCSETELPGEDPKGKAIESVTTLPGVYATRAAAEDPTMEDLSSRAAIGHKLTVAVGTTTNAGLYVYNGAAGRWIPETEAVEYPGFDAYDIFFGLAQTGPVTPQDGTLKGLLDADELKGKWADSPPLKYITDVSLQHVNSLFDFAFVGIPLADLAAARVKVTTADGDLVPYRIGGTAGYQAVLKSDTYAYADVALEFGGKTYWCTVDATDGTFRPNVRYKFNVVLRNGKLVLDPVSVSNWTEGGSGTGSTGKKYDASTFEITGYAPGTVLTLIYSDGTTAEMTLDAQGRSAAPFNKTSQPQSTIISVKRGTDAPIRIGQPAIEKTIRFTVDGNGRIQLREDAGVYLVGLIEELAAVSSNLSAAFKQDADLSLDGVAWPPVGTETSPFAGSFDGNGFSVTGLSINGGDNLGMFAYNKGTLKNMTVDGTVNGGEYVAALCAHNAGTIAGCTNKASVNGTKSVAGLCADNAGSADGGRITGCRNEGVISSSDLYCAGIVAHNSKDGLVSRCVNAGAVKGSLTAGGHAAGVVAFNLGTLTESGNTAAVEGFNHTGGVCGQSGSPDVQTAVITRCYNTGPVLGQGNVGGVIGYISYSTGEALWNTGAVSAGNNIGGVAGYVRYTPALLRASWNAGRVSIKAGNTTTTVFAVTGRYNNGGTGQYNYYNAQTSGTVDSGTGSAAFSATSWPAANMTGWGSDNWSGLGGWGSGGTTITYPRLSWE